MRKKILVTGATGTVGSEVVRALKNMSEPFKAAVRDMDKARTKLGTDVELVAFDFSDPATFGKALEGVDRVFLIGPPLDLALDTLLKPFIDALKQKNILHVLYLSALGEHAMPAEMNFHGRVEQYLRSEQFKVTVLRPSFFAQNFKNYEGENILLRNVLYSPAGSGHVAFVDIRDVGEVAATIFTQEGHDGKTYQLTGPVRMTYFDAAATISEVLHKTIHYPNPSPTEYTQTLKAAGAPDFIASYMIGVYGMINNGAVDLVTNDIKTILKREPTALAEVIARDFI